MCAQSQFDCGGFGDTCIWAADSECDVVGDFEGASIVSYCEAGTVRKNLEDTQRTRSLRNVHILPGMLVYCSWELDICDGMTLACAIGVLYLPVGLHRLSERSSVLRWRSLVLSHRARVV